MVGTPLGDGGPAGWLDRSHGHQENLVFPGMSNRELLEEIPISISFNGTATIAMHYRHLPAEVETNLDGVAT